MLVDDGGEMTVWSDLGLPTEAFTTFVGRYANPSFFGSIMMLRPFGVRCVGVRRVCGEGGIMSGLSGFCVWAHNENPAALVLLTFCIAFRVFLALVMLSFAPLTRRFDVAYLDEATRRLGTIMCHSTIRKSLSSRRKALS